MEKFLLHFFNYAETYTFLFSWVVVPLGFLGVFMCVKRLSTAVPQSEPITVKNEQEPVIQPPTKAADANKNLVNA